MFMVSRGDAGVMLFGAMLVFPNVLLGTMVVGTDTAVFIPCRTLAFATVMLAGALLVRLCDADGMTA